MMKISSQILKHTKQSTQVQLAHNRQGMALVVVMVAVSLSLVLTYSFMNTQAVVQQISSNELHQDLALQAAETGAALAVRLLQSENWEGVTEPFLSGTQTNAEGTVSSVTEFLPYLPEENSGLLSPSELALFLTVRSTGRWQSTTDSTQVVTKVVEAVVKMQPRPPGRTIFPGDSELVSDVTPNPGEFDAIQQFSVFASSLGKSLTLDPGDRIEGNLWLRDRLQFFDDPPWNSGVRNSVLSAVGTEFGGLLGVRKHPHPLPGTITFRESISQSTQDDLTLTGTPTQQATETPQLPAVNFSSWQTYRLFDKGFEYQAATLPSLLRNVELRPTASNPLGIFYRSGDLTIDDNVLIQGTVVSTGRIRFTGNEVSVSSFNWISASGEDLVSFRKQWQRLPALVARNIHFERDVRAMVEGAVCVKKKLSGAGGDLDYLTNPLQEYTGTATSKPVGQPFSKVKLNVTGSLTALPADGTFSVWLAEGNSGNWYPIVGVDNATKTLTVIGEVEHLTNTNFVLKATRKRYVDLRGGMYGQSFDINRLPNWDLTADLWNDRLGSWQSLNNLLRFFGLPELPLLDWLDNGSSFRGWAEPYATIGLSLEPTFHLRPLAGVSHRWEPPLFQSVPLADTTVSVAGESLGGYRWKVISWKVIP